MHRIQQLMKLHKLMNAAGSDGSDAGGGQADAPTSAEVANAGKKDDKASEEVADAQKAQPNKPSDAEAKLLKDVMKHKTRAQELEAALAQVNEKVKSFEGIDLEKVRTMLTEQEEAERKRLESKGEYDRLVKQMGERHISEKSTLQQQIEESNKVASALKQQIADLTIGSAFTSSKFVQEDLTLTPSKARVIYGSHFEFKDGKVVGYDKPTGASDRTMLVDSVGEPLGFESAMLKIIEADADRDQLIRSKMKQGAGSVTTPKGAKVSATPTPMSSVDRIAAGLKALAKPK
jgi:hypothetical protein